MTIKGSFILEHLHVKAIFGRKKSSESVPKMAVFRKFRGLHINCGHRDPQKAHPWPELCIFCKNPFRGVGCSELQEPKKALKTSPHGTIG